MTENRVTADEAAARLAHFHRDAFEELRKSLTVERYTTHRRVSEWIPEMPPEPEAEQRRAVLKAAIARPKTTKRRGA